MNPENDWIITNLKGMNEEYPDPTQFKDSLGKHSKKYSHEDVIAQIESYNPTISHYR